MSPLNQRRWQNFKKNRRGFYSAWIFLVIFVISLCTEFIANDKPIMFWYEGGLYIPTFFTYTDQELGGTLETEAWYTDPFTMKE
ncbi:MAG: ABC transporter permease, partial [Gammaproteobacteria bacterium]|nr:ABC transporter permease [Gammaproteobacteria bacterium]